MHRMPLLVIALDLPSLLDLADAMDERDDYYGKNLGSYFPEDDYEEAPSADGGGFEPNESVEG